MKRGEIWWAELPDPQASEPGYKRPVLIVQSDEFNASRISTVIIVTLTSNLKLADAPGNVYVSKTKSDLPKDSIVNVSQILTLDKEFLSEQIGALDNLTMRQIDAGLQLVLSV